MQPPGTPLDIRSLARRIAWTVQAQGILLTGSPAAIVGALTELRMFLREDPQQMLAAAGLAEQMIGFGHAVAGAPEVMRFGELQMLEGYRTTGATIPFIFEYTTQGPGGETQTEYRVIGEYALPGERFSDVIERAEAAALLAQERGINRSPPVGRAQSVQLYGVGPVALSTM